MGRVIGTHVSIGRPKKCKAPLDMDSEDSSEDGVEDDPF
jgi:hypothetical protein